MGSSLTSFYLTLKNSLSPTKKAALLAVLSAAAIATNFLMIGVVNVKFMDLIVFTAGYLFGGGFGAATGALIWLIYGTLNPYGFSLPILVSTMAGETLYGYTGGWLSRWYRYPEGVFDFRLAVTGFAVTFVYDLFTNLVSVYTVGIPVAVGLLSGVPFALTHELSNAAFFAFGFIPLIKALYIILGESKHET